MWLLTFSIIEKIHSFPWVKTTEDFINCTVTATLINDHCWKSVFAPATYHRLLGLCRTASGQKMNIFDLRLLASAKYIFLLRSHHQCLVCGGIFDSIWNYIIVHFVYSPWGHLLGESGFILDNNRWDTLRCDGDGRSWLENICSSIAN